MEQYRNQDGGFGVEAVCVPDGIRLTLDQQAAFNREFYMDVSELHAEQDQISHFLGSQNLLAWCFKNYGIYW